MDTHAKLIDAMIAHEKGCPERVGHFLKVYGFSKTISELEGLNETMRFITETAALVHDIGIKPSLEKYGSSAGDYQQREGPPYARRMLEKLGYDKHIVERVCYLVSRHHTFDNIDGADYQILVESDFLVLIAENSLSLESAQSLRKNIFKTSTGIRLLEMLYFSE